MLRTSPGELSITRLTELNSALHSDPTLRNLIGLLQDKLELGARLPVLVHEATRAGHERSARVFRSLSVTEDRQIAELLEALRDHLDQYSAEVALKET